MLTRRRDQTGSSVGGLYSKTIGSTPEKARDRGWKTERGKDAK